MTNIEVCEKELEGVFKRLDEIAYYNQKKVMSAFQEYKVATNFFAGTTGYGYDDIGRDTLEKIFADLFGADAAKL